jgi:hypothetical protein
MNLLQKFHAVLVSEDVRVWQLCQKRDGDQFYVWDLVLGGEPKTYSTLNEMIDEAYALIDPLKKALPASVPPPPLT